MTTQNSQDSNSVEYYVGFDPYKRETKWQRLLIFLRLRKRDKSVVTFYKKYPDGTIEYLGKKA
jgi:hypothetical protein